jgi:hypothetical protein
METLKQVAMLIYCHARVKNEGYLQLQKNPWNTEKPLKNAENEQDNMSKLISNFSTFKDPGQKPFRYS